MNISDFREKYCMDAMGAGVMNPDYKSKTGVEKRLHGSPNFDVNHFKKQHDAKLKSIKSSYEEYLREAEDQKDKDRAKRWYDKKVKDENQFWENIRKGRYNPMDIKTHYMVFTEQRPARAGAKGWGWFKKDSVEFNDASAKKRYELHYSATGKDGRSYLFVKEAVCTPGELKSVMKKVEDEQNAKGVTVKLMFKRSSSADSAEFENDETFEQWKKWADSRKKIDPKMQAEAHVVTAILNGKKFDKVFGSAVDAQNKAYELVIHGAKNVKQYVSVNGGPLKLEKAYASKSKDSAEFENDAVVIRKVSNPDPDDSYITVMMPDGRLSDSTWTSVKKAMDYIVQGNYRGAKVVGYPSKKILAK